MRPVQLVKSVLVALALVACAPEGEGSFAVDRAGLEGRSAELVFTADHQQRVEGTLVAGGIATISYDASRLTTCRGERYGNPAWSIYAHYRIAGGDVRSVHVAGHAPAPDQVGLPIELTQAGELEVWFENTSSFGCQGWDSAFGANHRFTIEAAQTDEAPIARFAAGGGISVSGDVRQSARLTIEYDVARLPQCRDTRYGLPAWSVLAHYRFPSGRTGYVPVTSGSATLDLVESGELQLWFENQGYYGCRAWDSLDGANYRVVVDADPRAPGWMGNAASVINRMTCDGGPCDSSRVALENGWTYGTYARQRAAIRAIYFDVWKAGVTDFDNANLWADLDVQVHYRWRSTGAFQTRYVRFFRRVGNDARYELPMAEIDPLAGPYTRTDPSQCPDADLRVSGDPSGAYVAANVEYYFTVNGVALRRTDGVNFIGTFEDYRSQLEICLQ